MKKVVQIRFIEQDLWLRARAKAVRGGETMARYITRLIQQDLREQPSRRADQPKTP